ncbi:MAG: hybrid sensor histidine kinase/response regulator [Nitrospirae bacterium]|uniref:sensor histidine kinase n=1 Tax=Candidatus Magnetobacterium casense TaxID=1455061 RepID=UPI000591639B|nr:hybrid sensor histidine kinase/response regulator [Candidatus Magnetobacterium casensis]MBF0337609.1 hybrid sensor histidine kinase/response regulator [Nitrospirota bacterium]
MHSEPINCLWDMPESMPEDSEPYLFFEEDTPPQLQVDAQADADASAWKVIIVDDEPEVHRATRATLVDFVFQERQLHFVSAFSAKEARQVIKDNADVSVIILDVVMESEQAGLSLVRYIRQELGNKHVRILIRTGQPGIAPEKSVIVDYDINGFLDKGDLTIQRFYTAIITCLRSYCDIRQLEETNVALKVEMERRIKAEKAMIEKERQAAIGLAIAQIIHGTKNILNALQGGKYIINVALTDNNIELLKEGWGVTELGIARMETLTADLLNVSRTGKLQLHPGSINDLVREITTPFQSLQTGSMPPEVEVIAELDDTLPVFSFDYKALHTALMNLVSNATDACRDKKYADNDRARVVIRTHCRQTGFAAIEVSDNGCGIRESDMENIFTMFYSTKYLNGNGLGLPITKKIVQEHGGEITVSSHRGHGTTFLIELPIKQEKGLPH